MTTWQYRVVRVEEAVRETPKYVEKTRGQTEGLARMRMLNEYGDQGWELVAVVPDRESKLPGDHLYYFKTPHEE